jgi:hypothetical protein
MRLKKAPPHDKFALEPTLSTVDAWCGSLNDTFAG